jgi:hypothetical protein
MNMRPTPGVRSAHDRLDSDVARTDIRGWIVVGVAACAALPAAAQTIGTMADTLRQDSRLNQEWMVGNYVDLNAGAYATDNARRTHFQTVSDTIVSAGMSLNTVRQGSRLDYDVYGDINYLKYADDIYKAEPYGVLDASASYSFVPERFDWVLRENFNRLLLDPTQSETLNNVETYNYITTGPRFRLHFSSSTFLVVQATYSRLTSIDSPNTVGNQVDLDGARYGANASLIYRVSRRGKLSLNLSSYRVQYADRALHSDFDRSEATVGYDTRIARTTFAAEVGVSRIKQQDDTTYGPLARIGLGRRISPSSTLELSFTRQTVDAADIVQYEPGGTWYESMEPLRVAARDPLVDTTAMIAWQFERPRTRLGVGVYRARERYTVSTDFDRDVTGAYGFYEWRLRRAWTLALSARFEGQSFNGHSPSDNEVGLSSSLNWDVGRRLRISFRAERFDRGGGPVIYNYSENRIGIRLGYALLRSHA